MEQGGLFQKIRMTPKKVTWKELLSDCRMKHSRRDVEYAMLAGSSIDRTNEINMLIYWRKPWLFMRVLWVALALGAICLGAVLISEYVLGQSVVTGSILVVDIVLSAIAPFTIMIFFWELNIPRNLSIYELLAAFLIGAVLSFFMTGLLYSVFRWRDSAINTMLGAPLREEPAKLLASVVMMWYFSSKKGKKLYGLTGLAIGAAVGAGFGVFESIDYAVKGGIATAIIRMLGGLSGHTLYCAPYAAAIALHSENGKLSSASIWNADVAIAFGLALAQHMFWNSRLLYGLELLPFKCAISISASWLMARWIVQKCLYQVVCEAKGESVSLYALAFETGTRRGQYISIDRRKTVFGRNPTCDIQLSDTCVSRKHCSILFDNDHQTLLLMDLNSTYGTFLNGNRLSPGRAYVVQHGDQFWLSNTSIRFSVVKTK